MAGKKKKAAKRKSKKKTAKKKASKNYATPSKPPLFDTDAGLTAHERRIEKHRENKRERPSSEFEVVHDRTVPFTEKVALHYLDLESFAGERASMDSHVAFLASEMEKGNFLMKDAGISIAVCEWDGKERKLNGQHSCWARLEMPLTWQPALRVTKYRVSSEDNYRTLYARFDRNKPRTAAHITNISLVGTPEFHNCSSSILKMVSQGFKFWKASDNGIDTKDPEAVAVALRSERFNIVAHRVIPRLQAISGRSEFRFMKRAAVYAAMMESFSKFKTISDNYWEKVMYGLNFENAGDPGKICRDYLMSHGMRTDGSNVQSQTQIATGADLFDTCVMCFNDFKAGKARRVAPRTKRNKRAIAK